MNRKWVIGLVAGCLIGAMSAPDPASAFGFSGFGGKFGYMSPEDLDGTVTVGGHLEFEQAGSQWHLIPNLMYWNSDGVSNVNPNFDVYYHFSNAGYVSPYLGAGVGLHVLNFEDSDDGSTDLGANVFGGIVFPAPAAHYFIEGRMTMTDVNQFGLVGGATFHR